MEDTPYGPRYAVFHAASDQYCTILGLLSVEVSAKVLCEDRFLREYGLEVDHYQLLDTVISVAGHFDVLWVCRRFALF